MPGVTKEQIDLAKQIELLEYLQRYEPQNLKRVGLNSYALRDHDSFIISNNKWCWFSRGFGCETATALNYLIKVRDYSFVEAVQSLTGGIPSQYHHYPTYSNPPPVKKPFILPPRYRNNKRAIAYLQSRGIDKAIILDCIKQGFLYESANHCCVFTGKNEEGHTRFACIRSTVARYRIDVQGSDKRYGFLLAPNSPESTKLACFEAPIDLLSHQTLCKQGFIDWDGWRLSLSGGSLMALTYFFENHPSINQVFVCTDRDEAGQKIIEKIAALSKDNQKFKDITVIPDPPLSGNDFNDELMAFQKTVPVKGSTSLDIAR